jgi:hypothetical protein
MMNVKNILEKIIQKRCVYLDLEYIHEVLGEQRPNPEHWKEVVQIGALEFDNDTGKEIQKLDLIIKPKFYVDALSEKQWIFFENLTHLKRDIIINGLDFKNAFEQLLNFIGNKQVITMLGDQSVLEYNAKLCGLSTPKFNFVKLKPLLIEADEKMYKPLFSSDLYKVVALTIKDIIPANEYDQNSQPHNALFDARSMAFFVHKMIKSNEG